MQECLKISYQPSRRLFSEIMHTICDSLCIVVVWNRSFIHVLQGCVNGIGTITRSPRYPWNNEYGWIEDPKPQIIHNTPITIQYKTNPSTYFMEHTVPGVVCHAYISFILTRVFYEKKASIEEATYAQGLVVLNEINMDRIAHLWWGILRW